MPRTKLITALSLATLFTPVFAFAQGTNPARPGTLNYVEGHASIDGHAVTTNNASGPAGLPVLNSGDSLSTSDGRAEVLLTPGIYLRLDHDSTVRMISPTLTRTEVALDRGHADLEVDALYRQNDVLLDEGASQTKVLNHGLYEFSADGTGGEVKVFEGKVAVSSSEDAARWVDVRGGHELALAGSAGKPQSFDRKAAQDDLYSWSSLRSDYLGQANASYLQAGYAGSAASYTGWAWNPYLVGYTWLPSDGFYSSPFGFGFYSPALFYGGGFGYYGGGLGRYGGGYYRGGGLRGGDYDRRGETHNGGAFANGGFHGGAIASGGFHGAAGGGFHGGGAGHAR